MQHIFLVVSCDRYVNVEFNLNVIKIVLDFIHSVQSLFKKKLNAFTSVVIQMDQLKKFPFATETSNVCTYFCIIIDSERTLITIQHIN